MRKYFLFVFTGIALIFSCAPNNTGTIGNNTNTTLSNTNTNYQSAETNTQQALSGTVEIIYLHHSTGAIVYNGGVKKHLSNYNANTSNHYQITELAYPHSPWTWENYPYDYWKLWVDQGDQEYYNQNETLTYFSQHYDVVVFKHCYPVAGIGENGTPDITSKNKTLTNYVMQYEAIKEVLLDYSNMRFILWTGPALLEVNTTIDQAQRLSNFVSWVKNEWDEPGDNIYLWDFYTLETEGELYLNPENAASSSDNHPSEAFGLTVSEYFVNRLVDVIEGNGDIGSMDGIN